VALANLRYINALNNNNNNNKGLRYGYACGSLSVTNVIGTTSSDDGSFFENNRVVFDLMSA